MGRGKDATSVTPRSLPVSRSAERRQAVPNLTHSLDSPAVATVEAPHPTERQNGFERAFALLAGAFLAVGYHVAVTVLKLFGRRPA